MLFWFEEKSEKKTTCFYTVSISYWLTNIRKQTYNIDARACGKWYHMHFLITFSFNYCFLNRRIQDAIKLQSMCKLTS